MAEENKLAWVLGVIGVGLAYVVLKRPAIATPGAPPATQPINTSGLAAGQAMPTYAATQNPADPTNYLTSLGSGIFGGLGSIVGAITKGSGSSNASGSGSSTGSSSNTNASTGNVSDPYTSGTSSDLTDFGSLFDSSSLGGTSTGASNGNGGTFNSPLTSSDPFGIMSTGTSSLSGDNGDTSGGDFEDIS